VSSDWSVFLEFLSIVKYNENNTKCQELIRRPCSDCRLGGHLLSCPTVIDVLDIGPVADDFSQADLLLLLAFALELRKITKKNYKNLFSDDIRILVISRKRSQ